MDLSACAALTIMTGAYSFICAYSSTDALCLRLNQVAWNWRVGDSYWYGDYVSAVPFPGVRIRIVDFPGRTDSGYIYESDIRIDKECTTPTEEIDAAYRNGLAQLPAHDVREIEWFD
jgi:hypothetical protein